MHDRSGKPLQDGDKVKLEGKIIQSSPGSDACEIAVQFDVPMYEGSDMVQWFNSKQVDKIE